ncbi:MAG: hypothetical protein PHR68_05545 [Candidatus Gracilibacteria bacterium]|nr:hypothetical protein [Candidatus Gracilibacteria bacterium]
MENYSFKILGKKHNFRNENELSQILSILGGDDNISDLIHWNIIMQLDDKLLKIIKTYKGLLKILKPLSKKNYMLLLLKIGDNLPNIVGKSKYLGEILARIPEETNKIILIKRLRLKGLRLFIRDAYDLKNLFEFVYDKAETELLDTLGEEFIKETFTRTNEIIITLHYLNTENKDRLINMLGLQNVYKKIKTYKDLLVMYKGLSLEKSKELLKLYKREELVKLFINDEEFHYFLLRLPHDKEKIFLNYLGL